MSDWIVNCVPLYCYCGRYRVWVDETGPMNLWFCGVFCAAPQWEGEKKRLCLNPKTPEN